LSNFILVDGLVNIMNKNQTEKKMSLADVVEIPSSGRKWWMSDKLFDAIKFGELPPNSYGETNFSIRITDLKLEVCYRRPDFITVSGNRGYIGLSRQDGGWHIGTPASALSQPLVDSMEALRRQLQSHH